MTKKAASKGASHVQSPAKAKSSASVGDAFPASLPSADGQSAPAAPVETPIAKFEPPPQAEAPAGWVKLPVELRPFWSPTHSKRPLRGVLIGQARLEVEGINVLIFRLSAETDVRMPDGQMGTARANQQVLVPQFYALGAVAALLSRQDLFYHIFIGNQRRVDVGLDDAGAPATIWGFDVVANPQGIPRTAPQT